MSLLVPRVKFQRYLKDIFTLIEKEIAQHKVNASSSSSKVQQSINNNNEVLICIKMMLKTFGDDFDSKIDLVQFINDMFYIGFNK